MKKQIITITLILFSTISLFAQNEIGQFNAISTGVPFLTIAPDARAGALGDAGVATTPDVNSIHWNPAKYAFIKEKTAINISYIPWLRKLVDDINFSNISSSFRIDENQVFAASLMYFSLGNIIFTDDGGHKIIDGHPHELSFDIAYALKLHKNLSGGIGLRYIHSNLTDGLAALGTDNSHSGNAVASDISVFYTNDLKIEEKKANLSFGLNISNLGTKISYTDEVDEFLPANMRLGAALGIDINEYNSFTIIADVNKLLVPTPPVYAADGVTIIKGEDPKVSVPVGVFQSFSDAPGGFSEELHELMYSVGLEYWYNKLFALRGGYFDEHSTKGNRKFFTMGVGVKLNVLDIDFAYIVPTAGRTNPLANTLRFSLGFNFSKLNKNKS